MVIEILKYLKARYVSEKAQGIVEYALILAFVAVIAAGLFGSDNIQGKIQAVFQHIENLLDKGKEAAGTNANG